MLILKFESKYWICRVINCESSVKRTISKKCCFCNRIKPTIMICDFHITKRNKYVCTSTICRNKMNTFPEFDFEYIVYE